MDNPIPHARNRLQGERQRRGWSRKYVAEQLDVSEYTIGQWERGKHMPYPIHIQKLCNLFETSAEALGLTTHVEASGLSEIPPEANADQASATNRSSRANRQRFLVAIAGIALVLVVAAGVSRYILYPMHIIPGGAWIAPTGSSVGDLIHFAAYAYPTSKGDPEIDHVNFTMYWQGVDPRTWKVVCEVRVPISKDVYACNVNLRLLGAPPGPITISFDVYDRQGNVNFAPNGEHHLVYIPS
jgi:transcriptional regulator with XRE-family HTH domain